MITKNEHTTVSMIHVVDGGFRKFSVPIKIGLDGQVRNFEMPYVSYPRQLKSRRL